MRDICTGKLCTGEHPHRVTEQGREIWCVGIRFTERCSRGQSAKSGCSLRYEESRAIRAVRRNDQATRVWERILGRIGWSRVLAATRWNRFLWMSCWTRLVSFAEAR